MKEQITIQLWGVWEKLKEHWGPYLCELGLDLCKVRTAEGLAAQLTEIIPKEKIHFEKKGLWELSRACNRGIEPGDPALSLFYHVLASPDANPEGIKRSDETYPTMADLEIVENFVYAARDVTLQDVQGWADDAKLAIVVFAYEYAPACDTVHKRHADLCFSRTGIGRVGSAEPHYEHEARGFFPHKADSKKVHAIPSRFGTFLAKQVRGNKATIGPLGFTSHDEERMFWVPIHKLFGGPDCIDGLDLKLTYHTHHVNEKIRRVHLALQSKGINTGWNAWQMDRFPFVITDELATFDPAQGLMIPKDHDPLIEPACTKDGRMVGFPVPHNPPLATVSLLLQGELEAHPWPQFVHIRHKLVENIEGEQSLVYLPKAHPDELFEMLKEGGFEAANFVDWTAEGFIKALCPTLAVALANEGIEPLLLAAYSVIGQPDFFPMVKQQDITEWWKEFPLKDAVWPSDGIVPTSLSGKRVPANFKLKGSGFDSTDTTMTAIIGFAPQGEQCLLSSHSPKRESTLSYRASNLFDPGWDTTQDFGRDAHTPKGTYHLANYGLGSPFPEDAQICAALGAFWPGAVPDLARFFAPFDFPTTTPLTDDEAKTWNGVQFPVRQGDEVQFQSFSFSDYVEAIREGKLDFDKFALLSLQEFILRTEITARFYQHLQQRGVVSDIAKSRERARIAITSFQNHEPSRELIEQGWMADKSETFRIEWSSVPEHTKTLAHPKAPTHPNVTRVTLRPPRVTLVGRVDRELSQAAEEIRTGNWKIHRLHD